MDKPAQKPYYVTRLFPGLQEEVFPSRPYGRRKVNLILVLVVWVFFLLFELLGCLVCQKNAEVVHGQGGVDLLVYEVGQLRVEVEKSGSVF